MKYLANFLTISLIVLVSVVFRVSGQETKSIDSSQLQTTITQDAVENLTLKSTLAGPNLTPYQPSGWDNKLVISNVTGTSTSTSIIFNTHTLYVDWAVINNGTSAIAQTFYSKLYVDGTLSGNWYTAGLGVGNFAHVSDHNIGQLTPGTHTIKIETDQTGVVAETNETDNAYTRTITVYPYVNLTTYQPAGWDNKIVLSTVAGTHTSDAQILSTETIYLDWAVANVSAHNTSTTFYIDLYIDGVWKSAWTRTGLNASTFSTQLDYVVGKLPPGSHTFLIRIDIDNYVKESNEEDNSYSRTITVYDKNVLPYKPANWDNKLVISTVKSTNTSAAAIYNNQEIYIDWAVVNDGSLAISETFHTKLYIDGVQKGYWFTAGVGANYWVYVMDVSIGKLATGWHTAQVVTDCDAEVAESNETDNSYSRTFYVGPSYNLTPYQPGGYDNKLVLSTVTGTGTSASVFYDTQTIYVDWACLNNANDDIEGTLYVRLYIDGVSRAAWTKTGLPHNTYTHATDQPIPPLSAGSHTFKLVVDADGDIAESDETDNEYSRTITVVNKNLLPHKPTGWDNKIVLSTVTGTNTSSATICETQDIYLDYSIFNNGTASITETFYVRLYIDGATKATWTRAGIGANTYYVIQDYALGSLPAGTHTARITADVLDNVNETSETDNEYTLTFSVSSCKNLTAYQPSGWDNKIVLSTVKETTTSAASIYDNQPIYLDWAIIAQGSNNITETFSTKLYIDGALKATWSKSGLTTGTYLFYNDYTVGTLTAGAHTFKIVTDANNDVPETNEGDNEYSRTITVLQSTPPAPVATAATAVSQTSFNANWIVVSGATGYFLDISTSNTFGTFVTGYQNKNVGNVVSSAVTGLLPGTTYYYRVRSANAGGSSDNSNVVQVTTSLTSPPAPIATAATAITQTGFNANWTAAAGATGYFLDVSISNTFGTFVAGYNDKNVGNVLTSAVTGLNSGTTYYYRVRASNAGGSSVNSNVVQVTTQLAIPAAPLATSASSISHTGFTANWNISAGASGYYLDISTNSSFSTFISGYNNKNVGNVLSSAVTGLTPCAIHYYRVRAYNAAGTSANSNVITAQFVNHAPTLVHKLSDQLIDINKTLTIPVSPIIGILFTDPDPGDNLTVSATRESGGSLPSFISHISSNLVISPTIADTGCTNIVIKASDLCNAYVTDTFRLCVKDFSVATALFDDGSLTIYPNPTSGRVYIETHSMVPELTVTVYNALGVRTFNHTYHNAGKMEVDLSGNVPGLFLISINLRNTTILKKVTLFQQE